MFSSKVLILPLPYCKTSAKLSSVTGTTPSLSPVKATISPSTAKTKEDLQWRPFPLDGLTDRFSSFTRWSSFFSAQHWPGAAVFLFLPSHLGDSYGAVNSAIRDMEQVLAAKVAGIYAIMAVFIALAVVVLHLFYSHRIAGPAYRLSREAEALGQGNFKGNIRFRKKTILRTWQSLLIRWPPATGTA